MEKQKLAVFFTGGTITMETRQKDGGLIPSQSPQEIYQNYLPSDLIADLETHQFSNIPGPHMEPSTMLNLAKTLQETLKREEIIGAVITHGTDTLEETAYFLNLLIHSDKPVVLTGAMRSPGEISPDGPRNLGDSILVASNQEAREKGAMVVFNEEIHAAREVVKTHTSSLNAFTSPYWGPLGRIEKNQVLFRHNSKSNLPLNIGNLKNIQLAEVEIIKTYSGCSDKLLKYLLQDHKLDGLVLEGMGKGNLPPSMVETVKMLIEKGVIIVLASRALGGNVSPEYSYPGGGKHLQDLGVIFAQELSPPQARLKLMLLIKQCDNQNQLENFFNSSYSFL